MTRKESRIEKRKSKKKGKKKVVILSIISILAVLILGGGSFAWSYFNNLSDDIKGEELPENPTDNGIDSDITDKKSTVGVDEDAITNIALFGLDQQNVNERGRSDSIMIMTIDKKAKKIKLSSLIRDSYVNIDGHGKDKLTHAYAFGGPQLAVKTINQNFGLDIKDYVTVNFFGFLKIIDEVGGIEIDVKKEEIEVANFYIREISNLQNIKKYDYITKPGKQNLSGIQAVGYSRNRYTGNGDYERTDRQRRVLIALMGKLQALNPLKYPGLIDKLSSDIVTSLDSNKILTLATSAVTSGIVKNIDQERFPVDGYLEEVTIKDIYYLKYKEKETKDQIFNYIFKDIKPVAK